MTASESESASECESERESASARARARAREKERGEREREREAEGMRRYMEPPRSNAGVDLREHSQRLQRARHQVRHRCRARTPADPPHRTASPFVTMPKRRAANADMRTSSAQTRLRAPRLRRSARERCPTQTACTAALAGGGCDEQARTWRARSPLGAQGAQRTRQASAAMRTRLTSMQASCAAVADAARCGEPEQLVYRAG
jgi:hypothetical protein